jgi:hypothetical protein
MEKATPHIWTPAKADAVLDELLLLIQEGRSVASLYKNFLLTVIIFTGAALFVIIYIKAH